MTKPSPDNSVLLALDELSRIERERVEAEAEARRLAAEAEARRVSEARAREARERERVEAEARLRVAGRHPVWLAAKRGPRGSPAESRA